MVRFFNKFRGTDHVPDGTDQTAPGRGAWFGKILQLLKSSPVDDDLWEQVEEILIAGDVGVNLASEIIRHLKSITHSSKDSQEVFESLKYKLIDILSDSEGSQHFQVLDVDNPPYVILVVGVNGVGKTTSIAKLAYYFRELGKTVILAAGDTYRAAAVEQLKLLGNKIGVEVISQNPGADPGAVAFDAFQAGKARNIDILIVDTAGRLHTKTNLIAESKKISDVLKRLNPDAPHQVILVLDATVGRNGLAQAKAFSEALGCTGIFLSKLDGTSKGGVVLGIKNEIGLPVWFIGTGENPQDLKLFEPKEFIEALISPV